VGFQIVPRRFILPHPPGRGGFGGDLLAPLSGDGSRSCWPNRSCEAGRKWAMLEEGAWGRNLLEVSPQLAH
jgi:hypothetical protein